MNSLGPVFNFVTETMWPVVMMAAAIGVAVGIARREWVVHRVLVDTHRQANREAWRWGLRTTWGVLSLALPALMLFALLHFG